MGRERERERVSFFKNSNKANGNELSLVGFHSPSDIYRTPCTFQIRCQSLGRSGGGRKDGRGGERAINLAFLVLKREKDIPPS